jgi:nicotinamide-nucleotide amidase
MRAEIIAIGTELLLGEITDTNTPFIARELASLGIDLYYASTVGDNLERLTGVLRMAWDRSDIVFTTGGLGPSQGDVTRIAIAGLMGEQPYVDEALKADLTNMFQKRGLEMTPNNIKQATLITSAKAILNPRGTAPGWWVEKQGHVIVCMPGPPGEMQVMWQSGVLPRLKARSDSIILSRTLKTAGLSESKIDDLLTRFAVAGNPTLATYAKNDGIHVRITAKAKETGEANMMINSCEHEVREALKDCIWGVDGDTIESVTGKMLLAKGLTLAVIDSYADGSIISGLVSVPGSGSFLRGGMVIGSDEGREALGVSQALLEQGDVARIASRLSELACSRLGASVGMAVHGEKEKDARTQVRLAIAIDGDSTGKHVQVYTQEPFRLRGRVNQYAFMELRKILR